MFGRLGSLWNSWGATDGELPEQEFKLINGIRLTVQSGDITSVSAGAVVVGENESFSGNGAVARVLLEKGGKEYEKAREQLIKHAREEGCPSLVYSCPAGGNLKFDYVFQALITHQSKQNDNWSRHLCSLFYNVALEADRREVATIATPLVGAGKANGDEDVSLRALVQGFTMFRPTVLRQVILVEFNPQKAVDMAKKISQILHQKPNPTGGDVQVARTQEQVQRMNVTQSSDTSSSTSYFNLGFLLQYFRAPGGSEIPVGSHLPGAAFGGPLASPSSALPQDVSYGWKPAFPDFAPVDPSHVHPGERTTAQFNENLKGHTRNAASAAPPVTSAEASGGERRNRSDSSGSGNYAHTKLSSSAAQVQNNGRTTYGNPYARGFEGETQVRRTSGGYHTLKNDRWSEDEDWDLIPNTGTPVNPPQANGDGNGFQTGNACRRPRRNFGGMGQTTNNHNVTQYGGRDGTNDRERGRGSGGGYGRGEQSSNDHRGQGYGGPNRARTSTGRKPGRGKATRRSWRQTDEADGRPTVGVKIVYPSDPADSEEEEEEEEKEEEEREKTSVEQELEEALAEEDNGETLPAENQPLEDNNRNSRTSSSSSLFDDEGSGRDGPEYLKKANRPETPPSEAGDYIPGPTFTAGSGVSVMWTSSILQEEEPTAGSYAPESTVPDPRECEASTDEGQPRPETLPLEDSYSTSDPYSESAPSSQVLATYAELLSPPASDTRGTESASDSYEDPSRYSKIWSSDQDRCMSSSGEEDGNSEEETEKEERSRTESQSSWVDSEAHADCLEEDVHSEMLTREVRRGNMPDGKMVVSTKSQLQLEGFPGCGTILIEYSFPNGTQGPHHPAPGQPYKGTFRRAYLPDNQEGQRVVELLQKAFERKLTFQLVQSGPDQEWGVEFADIPHKISLRGGPAGNGFPDSGYLQTVEKALRMYGLH